MTALLEVEGLSRRFGGLQAIGDLSFAVREGTVKSVIGPNGAGKTTLFNLVSGFDAPDAGSVRFRGEPIQGLPPHAVAARGMARTFQQIQLVPRMSVLGNVLTGRHLHTRAGFLAGLLCTPGSVREARRARARCRELLEVAGLADVAEADATSLPYGRQRLLELARALACEPRLLLLDEPAAGLNMRETEEMAATIRRIAAGGITVLVVEHDMGLVMSVSHEVLVLSYGRRIADGTPQEVQRDPEVIRVYLGEEEGDAPDSEP